MPRKTNWPPHISSNNGHDRVWIPARPQCPGYWMRLGPTGSPEAFEAFQRLIAEHPKPESFKPAERKIREGVSVFDVCQTWLDHYATLARSSGSLDRARLATAKVLGLYGSLPAREFRAKQLRAVQRLWAAEGLSRSYVRGLVGCVRLAWRHAVVEDLIPAELYHGLVALPGLEPGEAGCAEPREVQPVGAELVAATLPFLRPPVAAMVRVQLLTGMRPGELCRLTPGQVVRAGAVRVAGRGSVDVGKLNGVWVYAPDTHKSARLGFGRYVAVGPQAQAVLAPWLDGRADGSPCFSPQEDWERQLAGRAAARTTKLWPSHQRRRAAAALRPPPAARGDRYTVRGYSKAVARACAGNDLAHWHPHQLRHAAEVVAELAFDLDAARALLGHRDAKVTARYGIRDVLRAAEVAAKIG